MWSFVSINRKFGAKLIKSQNFDEEYIVHPSGSWVPEGDLKWLLEIKWKCAGCGKFPVSVFFEASPSAKQMKAKPDRKPKKIVHVRRKRKKVQKWTEEEANVNI